MGKCSTNLMENFERERGEGSDSQHYKVRQYLSAMGEYLLSVLTSGVLLLALQSCVNLDAQGPWTGLA